jgi:hypothetical protein
MTASRDITAPRPTRRLSWIVRRWAWEATLAKSVPKFDRRLLGTWKSDRRRTFKNFRPKPGATRAAMQRLKAMFGKLVIRWGRGKYHTEYDGHCESFDYEIVARDTTCVIIRCYDNLAREWRLRQITFDGDHYWIPLGGSMCECFRRVRVVRSS